MSNLFEEGPNLCSFDMEFLFIISQSPLTLSEVDDLCLVKRSFLISLILELFHKISHLDFQLIIRYFPLFGTFQDPVFLFK
jgi:hypothetical protein